jgi:hypothetical protein
MFTRFPSFMLTFDHAGVTFLHGIVGAMVNEKLNLYKKVEGIKLLMNVIKRFKGLEVESQSCFYQQNADGIIRYSLTHSPTHSLTHLTTYSLT